MTVYRVTDWLNRYETHESRKLKKLSWVPVPNTHDGLSFRRLISMPKGAEIFGAWCLILQVASKMDVRGTLENSTGPIDATDLAAMTGGSVKLFEESLRVLSSPKIGWIEQSAVDPAKSPGAPGFAPGKIPAGPRELRDTVQDITEQNKEGNKEARARFTPPTIQDLSAYCLERGNKVNPQNFLDHYEANGWRVGRNPMKDWRAAVRTWEKNDFSKGTSNGARKPSRSEILDRDATDLRRDLGIPPEESDRETHPAHGHFSAPTRTGT